MFKKILRAFISQTIKPLLIYYQRKPRFYKYKNYHLLILPEVFHPAFYFSTKYLLQNIEQLNLKNKTLLEMGAGSAIISFAAANNDAIVTSVELSKVALNGLHENINNNPTLNINIIQSDLFDQVPKSIFDYIVVNPPYYPKNANNDAELAWYCGKDFEYFEKFFIQVKDYMNKNTKIIMVLSDDCDINKIKSIATKNKLQMTLKHQKNFSIEINFIYEITL